MDFKKEEPDFDKRRAEALGILERNPGKIPVVL